MAAKKKGEGGKDLFDGVDDDPPEKESKTEVQAEDDGPELELEEPEEDDAEEQQLTRREKRRNRYSEQVEARRQAEADAARYKQEAEIARLQAQQAAMQQRLPQTPQADPYQEELQQVWEEHEGLTARWNALTDEQRLDSKTWAEYQTKARSIEEKKLAIVARREMDQRGLRQQNPNDALAQRISVEFPDVAQNERAARWAQGYLSQQVAMGKQMSWPLLVEAMNETRRAFRMTSAPAATSDQRARYTSPAQGGGADAPARKVIKMTREYRAMAEARFPKDPPKVAYQKWANTAGKKLV